MVTPQQRRQLQRQGFKFQSPSDDKRAQRQNQRIQAETEAARLAAWRKGARRAAVREGAAHPAAVAVERVVVRQAHIARVDEQMPEAIMLTRPDMLYTLRLEGPVEEVGYVVCRLDVKPQPAETVGVTDEQKRAVVVALARGMGYDDRTMRAAGIEP